MARESLAVLTRLQLVDIPQRGGILRTLVVGKYHGAFAGHVLVAVAEVDAVQHSVARIGHMTEERRELIHLRNLLRLGAGMRVEPCLTEQQRLGDAEAGIVDALVHAAVAVECPGLVLYHVAGKVKPLRYGLHHGLGSSGCLGHLVAYGQCQQTAHAGARRPPVVAHRVERVYARRLVNPVAQQRLHRQAVQSLGNFPAL